MRSLRTVVSAIGLAAAIITAVSVPAGYFAVGYLNLTRSLDFRADLNARDLARYIYAHDTLWRYQRVRLAELLEHANANNDPMRKRVIDAAGALVLEEGPLVAAPSLVRNGRIVVAGNIVGRVEIETSLRPLLRETGEVAILSFLLGAGVFFAVRVFPLRVLDQTLGRLDQTNRQLDGAVSNMSQGLVMFDSSQRLMICNRRYLEMYGLSPDESKPGCTIRELLAHRKRTGTFLQDIDEYCAALEAAFAQGKGMSGITEIPDGRSIHVVNQPMADGGWVATHEDITEQRQAERERDRNRQFLELIIDNVPATIFVKRASDRRYVLVNRAGERFWGIPPADMIGKTSDEVFPDAEAELIAARDDEVFHSDQAVFDEREIDTFPSGTRSIASRKLIIQEGDGESRYLLGVVEDITERKRAEARIAHLAHYDALTDLPNRVLLRERLEQELTYAPRGAQLAVLYLDLDHFKSVNDTLGHSAGDALLKAVADRLRGCLRESDMIARLGGDEFAIVQAPLENPADATVLAQRLRDATVQASYELNGHQVVIDTSIGIALSPNDGTEVDQLLKSADMALYGAKSEGRGTFRYFQPEMDARMKKRRNMEIELRKAVVNADFELYYQPLLNVRNNEISSCEALLRWHHPERGMISPAEFIPIAEETGLIVPIGEWVLRQACADAAKWRDDIKVAVNLSPAQFRNQSLPEVVISALAAAGLPPYRLELEITESVLMQNNDTTVRMLHQLRQLGVGIAMDDFGTGYSSLSYLRSFPFDKIKIDRSFVRDLGNASDAPKIIEAITALARSLNMTVTAEGVETEQQSAILRAMDCTEMQGFLFSMPRPVAEILPLVMQKPMKVRHSA